RAESRVVLRTTALYTRTPCRRSHPRENSGPGERHHRRDRVVRRRRWSVVAPEALGLAQHARVEPGTTLGLGRRLGRAVRRRDAAIFEQLARDGLLRRIEQRERLPERLVVVRLARAVQLGSILGGLDLCARGIVVARRRRALLGRRVVLGLLDHPE